MKIKFNKDDFKLFYKKNNVVREYDKKRLSTIKKRVVRRLERNTAVAKIKSGNEILEIGVGTGYITKSLLNYGYVTGIDSSETMLKRASKNLNKYKRNLRLINGSIFNFKLNKKFDYIVTYRVFMHFDHKNIKNSLNNIKKHMKKNSYLVFDLPSKSFLKKIIYYIKLKIIRGEEVYNYSYSKKDIKFILKNYNFEIVNILAIDHAILFLPIYAFLNKTKGFFWLEELIYHLETKLFNFHLLNTRWIVVLKNI